MGNNDDIHIHLKMGFSRSKWKKFLGIPFPPIGSWVIKAVIRKKYSHVYWGFQAFSRDEGGGFEAAYEAAGGGLNFSGPSAHEAKTETIHYYAIPVTREQYRMFIRKCMLMAGQKYDTMGAIGAGVVILAERLGFDIKNPFSNGNSKWFCNEIGAWLANEVLGWPIDKADIEQGGPEMLDEMVHDLIEQGKIKAEKVILIH